MAEQTSKETGRAPGSRLPLVLSAIMPGAGQFAQGRWLPGVFWCLSFMAVLVLVLVRVVRLMADNLRAAGLFMDGDGTAQFSDVTPAELLLPLGAGLLLYALGLLDTHAAYRRQAGRQARERLRQRLGKLAPVTIVVLLLVASPRLWAGPIHNAVRANDLVKLAEVLGNRGPAEVNATAGAGVTPLHLAAALDHSEAAALLICRGANLEMKTEGGFTPLHWAVSRNATNTTDILIKMGADVDAQTDSGVTPLHWASTRNATECVKLLVRAGADFDKAAGDGLRPLHWAVMTEAGDAAVVLAYQQVTDNMAREHGPHQATAKRDGDEKEATPSAAAVRPQIRVQPGKTLTVPIGLGQALSLVWIEPIGMWVGRFEITNGQFRRFRPEHDSMFRDGLSLNDASQPAVLLNWHDAQAYCDWLNRTVPDRVPLNMAFRLPAEAEWAAFAGCGDGRRYPWGNAWPPLYGNLSDLSARRELTNWRGIDRYDDGFAVTCPVMRSGVNEWGIYGLAGNAWEWCSDWSDQDRMFKVRRGGSWDFDTEENLRIESRGFDRPEAKYDTVGFRVVLAPQE